MNADKRLLFDSICHLGKVEKVDDDTFKYTMEVVPLIDFKKGQSG
jgi:hypothetical protein